MTHAEEQKVIMALEQKMSKDRMVMERRLTTLEMKAPKKYYIHDGCKGCIFLGNLRDDDNYYDLYYCPQNGVPTVIARYGDEGYEYMSGILSAMNPLKVAKARAVARGFEIRPARW